MTRAPTETAPLSLAQTLAEFQAKRAGTMEPAALAENLRFRAALVARAPGLRLPQAGDRIPDFTLQPAHGPQLTRDSLLADGPVVLIFFRFAGCPACNIALPWYDRNLRPGLAERGIRLIGVSPQIPERLAEIGTRHGLGFPVATDPGNALARALGISFAPDETARDFAKARDSDIAVTTGAGNDELPMPTVLLIGTDGVIRIADTSPDWLARTEANAVLTAADQLLAQA